MSEIKTEIIKLQEGIPYIPKADEYLITEIHTCADILRFLVDQSGYEDVKYLID